MVALDSRIAPSARKRHAERLARKSTREPKLHVSTHRGGGCLSGSARAGGALRDAFKLDGELESIFEDVTMVGRVERREW